MPSVAPENGESEGGGTTQEGGVVAEAVAMVTRPLARHQKKSNIEYTDVVVIGNGPSGICLSYMLSGYWPYYTGASHSDELLQTRLQVAGTDASLIEQDLEYLSDGMEGRSSNPLAVLFDALTHPDADLGTERESLLRWELKEDHVIPHVVLGKAAEGGIWQMLDGQVQTLSLGTWMELPDLSFKDWLAHYRSHNNSRPLNSYARNRASMDEVRNYYMDYVKRKGLGGYMQTHSVVTSVERVLDVCHCVDSESGEQAPCNRDHSGKFKWEVRGYRASGQKHEEFYYRAPNVVLATGCFDQPNKLGVPGEHLPYILHSIPELEKRIRNERLNSESDPIVVIGAGLSAADTILYAMSQAIPVIHVFRREADDPQIVYKSLPTTLYPEYHQVHAMMKKGDTLEGTYRAFPLSTITEFLNDGKVIIRSQKSGKDNIVKSSCVVVQIGSKPDLSFLHGDGKNLGIIPAMKIDSKHNPIDIDQITYQSTRCPGLFAMGPLIGDNFVRFLRGGALGITAHLWKKRAGKL